MCNQNATWTGSQDCFKFFHRNRSLEGPDPWQVPIIRSMQLLAIVSEALSNSDFQAQGFSVAIGFPLSLWLALKPLMPALEKKQMPSPINLHCPGAHQWEIVHSLQYSVPADEYTNQFVLGFNRFGHMFSQFLWKYRCFIILGIELEWLLDSSIEVEWKNFRQRQFWSPWLMTARWVQAPQSPAQDLGWAWLGLGCCLALGLIWLRLAGWAWQASNSSNSQPPTPEAWLRWALAPVAFIFLSTS